jgi:hypothetical protein
VSTQAHDLEPQLRQLRAAGCTEIFEEKASGTSRARPELARLLNRLRTGDTLVVVALTGSPDHCRTCSPLSSACATPMGISAPWEIRSTPRTLGDAGAEIMGAIAQFERALISSAPEPGSPRPTYMAE